MSQISQVQVNGCAKELAVLQHELSCLQKALVFSDALERIRLERQIREHEREIEPLRLKIRNFELEKKNEELQKTAKSILDKKQSEIQFLQLKHRRNQKILLSLSFLLFVVGFLISKDISRNSSNSQPESKTTQAQPESKAVKENQSIEKLKFSTFSSQKSYVKILDVDRICKGKDLVEYVSFDKQKGILTIGKIYFDGESCRNISDPEKIFVPGKFVDQSSLLERKEDWICKGNVTFNKEEKSMKWTFTSKYERCTDSELKVRMVKHLTN